MVNFPIRINLYSDLIAELRVSVEKKTLKKIIKFSTFKEKKVNNFCFYKNSFTGVNSDLNG